jgi:hypothetical protein
MPWPMLLSTAKCSQNKQKQWICDSIGYTTENANNNSIFWRPGKLNYADYWTKHHSAAHHINICKEFLTPLIVLEMKRQAPMTARAA